MRVEDAVALLQAGHDPLDRLVKSVIGHGLRPAAGGQQGGLVDQVGEIGAGEARGQGGDLLQADLGGVPDLLDVHREDLLAALLVRPVDQHLAVEAAGAQQGRVQDLRPVGGAQEHHALRRVEAVELGQQLVECLLTLVVAPGLREGAAGPAQRVELVDEDDGGCRLARLLEQIAHARRSDAYEHLDELGARDREERHAGLAGHGLGEHGLARAGRAHQQDALGDPGAQQAVLLGVLEEIDDLDQLRLGLVDAGHVGETRLGLLLDIDLGPGAADRHQAAEALLFREAPEHEGPDGEEDQDRHDPGHEVAQEGVLGHAGELHARLR